MRKRALADNYFPAATLGLLFWVRRTLHGLGHVPKTSYERDHVDKENKGERARREVCQNLTLMLPLTSVLVCAISVLPLRVDEGYLVALFDGSLQY